jgi:ribosomal protein L16 Arg81 hydroxylase
MSDKEFWKMFVDKYWKKHPAVFSNICQFSPQVERQVYEGLLNASNMFCDGIHAAIRFYIEHSSLRADLYKYLPLKADGSITEYIERIRHKVNHRDFALVVNNFQVHQPQLWLDLRRFFLEFYRIVGIPEDTLFALFIGDYTKTPFGIHTDLDNTFYFIVKGKKRFYLWPYEFAKQHNAPWPQSFAGGSTDYSRYLDQAITIEGKAGDLLYLPSKSWHVAESDPGDSAALSIGIPKMGNSFVREVLTKRIEEITLNPTERMHPVSLPSKVGQDDSIFILPDSIEKTKETYNRTVLDKILLEEWLNRISSLGYRNVPAPCLWTNLSSSDWITASPGVLIYLRQEEEILCSAHGHFFRIPYHPKLFELLQSIGKGGRWQVTELLNQYSDNSSMTEQITLTERGLQTFLEKILTLRAISVER